MPLSNNCFLDPDGWLNNFYVVFISFFRFSFFSLILSLAHNNLKEEAWTTPLFSVEVVLGLTPANPYCSPMVCQGWPCPANPALLLLLSRRPKTEILSKDRFGSRPGASLLHHTLSGTSLIVLLLCGFCQLMQIFGGEGEKREQSLCISVLAGVWLHLIKQDWEHAYLDQPDFCVWAGYLYKLQAN